MWDEERWLMEETPGNPNDCETNDARQIVCSINALVFQVRRLADTLEPKEGLARIRPSAAL